MVNQTKDQSKTGMKEEKGNNDQSVDYCYKPISLKRLKNCVDLSFKSPKHIVHMIC